MRTFVKEYLTEKNRVESIVKELILAEKVLQKRHTFKNKCVCKDCQHLEDIFRSFLCRVWAQLGADHTSTEFKTIE